MPNPTDFLPLNPRDYLVLFSLTEGERHGYGIVQEVEAQSSGLVKMDPSNLYRSIKRLIGHGMVSESSLRTEPDRERRRYYAITEFGREVVREEALRLHRLTESARGRQLLAES